MGGVRRMLVAIWVLSSLLALGVIYVIWDGWYQESGADSFGYQDKRDIIEVLKDVDA